MKNSNLSLFLCIVSFLGSITLLSANPEKSRLNDDPDVIYLEEHIDHTVVLTTVEPSKVYGDKNGNRRLGVFPADTKLELLAISEKSYRVKGDASHARVSGWVDPLTLKSQDENFIVNLKKLYERQMIVKELVANHDIAIGMTLDEVVRSLGDPTEVEVTQTRNGETGKWEYIVTEEQKHFNYVTDSKTGHQYRQLSHVTIEEKSRTTLNFEENVINSITKKKTNGRGKVRIISTPIIFNF
ncbi:MAG: hypothetical protein ACSHX0_12190 [Akkermansiaceae bacterium]